MEVRQRLAHCTLLDQRLGPLMAGCSSSPELQQLGRPAAQNCPLRLERARRQQPLFTQQSHLWRAGQRPRPHYVHTVECLKGFGGHPSARTGVGAGNRTLPKAPQSVLCKFTMVAGENKVWEQSEPSPLRVGVSELQSCSEKLLSSRENMHLPLHISASWKLPCKRASPV